RVHGLVEARHRGVRVHRDEGSRAGGAAGRRTDPIDAHAPRHGFRAGLRSAAWKSDVDGASPRGAGATVTTTAAALWHTREVASAPTLFAPDLPGGFRYAPDFITAGEENALVADLAGIAFSNFAMRGVVARRRV